MHISRDKCKMEFPALAPPGSVTGVDASGVVRLNLLTLPPALEAQTIMPMAADSNVVSNSQNSDCGNLGSTIIIQPEELKTEDVKKECVGVKQETYNDVMEINGLIDIEPQPNVKHGLIDIKPQPGLGDIKPNKQHGLIDIKPQLELHDIKPRDQQELNDINPQLVLGDIEHRDKQELIDIKPRVSEICDSSHCDEKRIEADLVRPEQGATGGYMLQTLGLYIEPKFAPFPITPELNPIGPKPIEIIPKPEVPPSEGTELNAITSYRRHSVNHNESRPLSCKFCHVRLLTDSGFRKHMRCLHNDNYFPCALCRHIFSEKSELRRHVVREHPGKMYECETCGKFISRAERTTHNHNSICSACGMSYSDQRQLNLHKLKCKAALNKKTYSCKVCREEFKNQNKHQVHMNTHKKERERNFACEICGACFHFVSRRDKHMKKQHPKTNSTECSYCGLRFKDLRLYKKHLKRHTEKDTRPECDACGFKSTSKEFLAIHKAKKHGGPLPRECPECSERFLTATKLKKHIDEKHPQTNTSEVSTEANLNATEKTPPKYQCKHCQKTFYKRKNLWSHEKNQNIHPTIVKAFKCDFCIRSYKHEEGKIFHIWEKHGGPMPYTCNQCGEGFTSMTKTANHIKTSHAPQNMQKETGDDKSVTLSSVSTPDLKRDHGITGKSNCHLSAGKGGQLREVKTGKFCNTLRHVCQDCGAAFSSKLRLLTHICKIPEHTSTDNNLNGNQKIPIKYLCEQLRKTSFKRKKKLVCSGKKRLRTMMKAFKCDFCNRSYKLEELRLRHIWEKHGGPMPYSCNECGEGFTCVTNMAYHIKTSHAAKEETGNEIPVPSSNVSTSDLKLEQELAGESNLHLNDDKGTKN